MKKLMVVVVLLVQMQSYGQTTTETYPEDSASVEHSGVPKGEVRKFSFNNSRIFPGTSRDYWIYIPAQYRPDKPACVYINQDGIQWKAPTVFDNLINAKEMPVTIGIFINPGIVKALDTAHALNRYNRSFEYDGLGDAYARFILEEMLPEVEKQKASDGREIKLSKSGNDRAIGGSSSGAVCAFTAAWERPSEFSRVFSAIGTYVGLRGADRYPTLVRKYEPKPLRIFLQDGTNDLNIYAGDWWKANETMERALTFSGYESKHIWGEGQHSGRHGTAIFPEVMRFLWKDWPKPMTTGSSKNQFINDILIPGSKWELVGQGYGFTEGTAADAAGNVFFHDILKSKTYKVDAKGALITLPLHSKKSSGTSFGSNGKRYVVAGETKQILSYDASGKEAVVASDILGNDLVVAENGNIYVTSPDGSKKPGKLYLIKDGKKIEIDAGLKYPNGVTLSPDQTQLYITESSTHWVWVYQVQPDGSLANKQRYGWLHETDIEGNAWGDGLKCDRDGRVYVATRLGIQILDQTGRVNAIIPIPSGQASNVCFGGTDFDTLYVSAGDKVFRRKVKVHGANTFDKPIKPTAPRL
ncbi:SMP-30/gluconolactonase/LRE family protein [Segetibacter aerophilus]|uniref:Gluconolactonase n=1 Tax=Segetibacter aerophilus TaxID=670293 RepID=A0A512BDT9_9BACT|nr:SMP-30/gluconolactonase/LRE family protein [Segetibacter aerophilus]GEO10132.1 gluconolactonase [Segetibacter aerophilus]